MNILVCVALEKEVDNFGKNISNLLITGVGKINASYSLTKELSAKKYDMVLNLGTCGANGKDIYIGDVVYCDQFATNSFGLERLGIENPNLYPSLSNFFPKNTLSCLCFTADAFVESANEVPDYPVVFDMEAYALARVCRNENIPFVSYKYVTDKMNKEDWVSIIRDSSLALYEIYDRIAKKHD